MKKSSILEQLWEARCKAKDKHGVDPKAFVMSEITCISLHDEKGLDFKVIPRKLKLVGELYGIPVYEDPDLPEGVIEVINL